MARLGASNLGQLVSLQSLIREAMSSEGVTGDGRPASKMAQSHDWQVSTVS